MERAIFGEALCCLALAQVAVRLFPVRRIVGWLDRGAKPCAGPIPTGILEAVGRAVQRAADYSPWDSACLAQALAGKAMLRRRGIATTFYLGVARAGGGGIAAHAWLCCGEILVTGGPTQAAYTVIAQFPHVGTGSSECHG